MNPQLLAGALLGLLLLAAAVAGQQWQHQALLRHLAERDLDRALPAQAQMESYRGESLHIRATSLSDDQALVAYIAQALESADLPGLRGDVSSVSDLLLERASQLGFDVAAVLSNDGEVRASSNPLLARGLRPLADDSLFDTADTGQPALSMLLLGDQPLLVTVSSMQRGGSFDGYLLAGVSVGSALLQSLAASSGNSVGLFHLGNGRIRPLQSSVGMTARLPSYATGLLSSVQAGAAWANGLTEPARSVLRVDGHDHLVQLSALFSDPRFLLVHQPEPEASDPGGLVQTPWSLAGFTMVIALAVYLLWLQWSLLRPLRQLPVHLEAAARGDLHRRIPLSGGALARRSARAFNALLQSLRQ
jgi:hypothetical protein